MYPNLWRWALAILLPLAAPLGAAPGEVPMTRNERVLQALVALTRLPVLAPAEIAEVLGGTLGEAHEVTPHRVETPILGCATFAEATVIAGGRETDGSPRWVAVTLSPEDLTLEQVEARFRGRPHQFERVMAHHGDGPRLHSVDHLFGVAVGMLVVHVDPESERGAGRITGFTLTTDVRPGLVPGAESSTAGEPPGR